MLSRTRSVSLALAAAAALTLSLAACAPAATDVPSATADPTSTTAPATDGDCAGVTVIVDTGDLEVADDPSSTTCVDTDGAITGAEAVTAAGLTTVGTKTYPDDVVCRVNGVPAEDTELPSADGGTYFESCADMPAATAYWSLWLKTAGAEWEYAPASLPGLSLNPGDSVELLFTLNGSPESPADLP